MLTGDAQCSAHCIELGERAALPYLHMLELWLYRGMSAVANTSVY